MTATEKVTLFLEQLSRATALLEKMLKVASSANVHYMKDFTEAYLKIMDLNAPDPKILLSILKCETGADGFLGYAELLRQELSAYHNQYRGNKWKIDYYFSNDCQLEWANYWADDYIGRKREELEESYKACAPEDKPQIESAIAAVEDEHREWRDSILSAMRPFVASYLDAIVVKYLDALPNKEIDKLELAPEAVERIAKKLVGHRPYGKDLYWIWKGDPALVALEKKDAFAVFKKYFPAETKYLKNEKSMKAENE